VKTAKDDLANTLKAEATEGKAAKTVEATDAADADQNLVFLQAQARLWKYLKSEHVAQHVLTKELSHVRMTTIPNDACWFFTGKSC